jgi:hypothetical protein
MKYNERSFIEENSLIEQYLYHQMRIFRIHAPISIEKPAIAAADVSAHHGRAWRHEGKHRNNFIRRNILA